MTVNEMVLHGVINHQYLEIQALKRRAQKAEGELIRCKKNRDTYGTQRNVYRATARKLEQMLAQEQRTVNRIDKELQREQSRSATLLKFAPRVFDGR